MEGFSPPASLSPVWEHETRSGANYMKSTETYFVGSHMVSFFESLCTLQRKLYSLTADIGIDHVIK